MGDNRFEALIDELSVDEKIGLLTGATVWRNHGVDRLGIPALKMTDGPNGARGESRTVVPAVVVPVGIALGASWDVDLVRRVGELVGREARRRQAHILLGPTINIARTPIGGRNFECYGEDPELTARLAVGFIHGVQSNRVAATPKHFLGNDTELERHTVDVVVDERTLREVYLRPFEAAVIEADAKAVMSSYNLVNGVHATENRELLRTILRDEWGFDGLVVSDWFATTSTVATAVGGTTIEMPGPARFFGRYLRTALDDGDLDQFVVDGLAREVLRVADWVDPTIDVDAGETSIDEPSERALCREAAIAGMVLLRNERGVLPIDTTVIESIAVIGPLADRAQIMGGGSSSLIPLHLRSPLQALTERLGPRVKLAREPGAAIDKWAPLLPSDRIHRPDGEPGVHIEYVAGHDPDGPVVATDWRPTSKVMWFGGVPNVVDPRKWSARVGCRFRPERTGMHRFGLTTSGRARVLIDGIEVVGWTDESAPRSEAFFGTGGPEVIGEVELSADVDAEVLVEFFSRDGMLPSVQIGCHPPRPDDMVGDAVAAASEADIALVFVGTTDEWETEGNDRESMDLPAGQDDLVRAVAAVNDRTIVVLTAGSAVTMDWEDDVEAVIATWFGGQEMADALVDVLFGDADPGGRLPVTFPVQLDDHPARDHYPGRNGVMHYGEGVLVGHRGYDAAGAEVRYPFGHGLSYTTFDIGEPSPASVRVSTDISVAFTVPVQNSGRRAGSTVVQVYIEAVDHRLQQPEPRLVAFERTALGPGERREVMIELGRRSFACWDVDVHDWIVDPGRYRLHIGESSRQLSHAVEVTIEP
ncbi:MAG: glycoside hydrolase family 3 C-terminal domain-containing protein [Acidimicrobiia bacterium]|nr:glycoside hydrolase family 3 C-terminal domain-containing protein [Acidimicrobiia bacterium]